MKDHSTKLVGIADQLGDLPFGLVQRRPALAFCIILFWIIRRHSTNSWNCSATRQLLLFTTDLILSFMCRHTRTKGKDKTFWRHAEWVQRFLDIHFFVLSGLPVFSDQHLFQLTQDQKGLFKACYGDECKGMVI
ncbi:hypothetical protein H5410_003569 [Solanum commersonii]|uniref:Uncharacterized protein n=1 Tax=Solanum commersonii TaxID=4109 RepID=A0A9J6B5I6_SOLCO|nr:hypothetical protein H5410_003569 [Solanum commersonii]